MKDQLHKNKLFTVLDIPLVSQARPNQPQCGLLSVSHQCVMPKVIRAGVGWVWLARLDLLHLQSFIVQSFVYSDC